MIYRYHVPFAIMDVKQLSSIGFLRGRPKEWLPLSHLASDPLRFCDMNIEEIADRTGQANRPCTHPLCVCVCVCVCVFPLARGIPSLKKKNHPKNTHLHLVINFIKDDPTCQLHLDSVVWHCVPKLLGLPPLHYLIEWQRKARPASLWLVPQGLREPTNCFHCPPSS